MEFRRNSVEEGAGHDSGVERDEEEREEEGERVEGGWKLPQ